VLAKEAESGMDVPLRAGSPGTGKVLVGKDGWSRTRYSGLEVKAGAIKTV